MVDLELPETTDCPLCGNEQVQLQENKKGKPYFKCDTLKTTVNLHANDANEWIQDNYLDLDADVEEPEEPGEDDDGDIGNLLGGGDDE